MMMKRSLTKSSSTAGQIHLGLSSTSTQANGSNMLSGLTPASSQIPSYSPLSHQLTSSNSNTNSHKQQSQQTNSESASNIYTILQDSKRSKQVTQRNGIIQPSGSVSSASSQNLSAALQAALSSAKSNPQWGLPLSSLIKTQNSVQSTVSALSSPPSQSSLITSQQQGTLPAAASRHLASTSKQSGSLQSNSSGIYTSSSSSSTSNAIQKSPVNQNASAYRSQTQTTPTSLKNSTLSTMYLSPKSNLQAQLLGAQHSKQGSNTNTAPVFHSHRPSLAAATASSSTSSHNNNENIPISNNRRHDSKPEIQKKASASAEQSSLTQYQSILKENNSLRNNQQITKITKPSYNSTTTSKDIPEVTRNYRNHSSSAVIEGNTISTGNQDIINMSQISVNSSSTGIATNQERNYRSVPKSPTSTHLNKNKNSVQTLFNQSQTNAPQPTEYLDSNSQHGISTDQSAINLSALSSNISQLNMSEKGTTDQVGHLETSQSDILLGSQQQQSQQQHCTNHPYKKAKYIIFNSTTSNNLYCSKCAVELSKFGFQTIHISDYSSQKQHQYALSHEEPANLATDNQRANSNSSVNSQQDLKTLQSPQTDRNHQFETQTKLTELKAFLENIDSQGGKWQELNHALLIKKQDVCNFYDRQEQRIDAQFTGYMEIIQKTKDSTLERVIASKEKSVQAYQQWEKETKENLTDFINIKADIEMNNDKIVNQIQMEDFKRIMSSYKDKLARMTQFFHEMANQCLDLVKFDTHSPLPVTFAPQIQESFSVINFTTTLVKKRVSEFVSAKKSNSQSNNSLLYSSNQQSQQHLGYRNTDNSPSPNMKSSSSRMSLATAPVTIDTYSSNGVSTRGSVGNSSAYNHFGSGKQNQQPYVQLQSQSTGNDSISDYSQYYYPQITGAQTSSSPTATTQGNHSNSPVKIDLTTRSDLSKKDVYVSFGNNKDAQLQKAIQQVKTQNAELLQQQQQQQATQQYLESLQQTPAQNNGVYVHKIKPLTDIIENSNIQDEEDDSKSQPNTPELKQVDLNKPSEAILSINQSQSSQQQQQRPFRTLFGEEEALGGQASQQQLSQYKYAEVVSPTPTADWIDQQQQNKQPARQNGTSSVSSKSPRYSMYDCEESDNAIQYDYPKVSSTNNQLDDYIQMLERQNGPLDFQYTQQKGVKLEVELNEKAIAKSMYSYHYDESDVIVNMKNDEDYDNPLFSSPKQEQQY